MQSRLAQPEVSFNKTKPQPRNYVYKGYDSFEEEKENEPVLKEAWQKAEEKVGNDADKLLIAKFTYALDDEEPPFHKTLNEKLREWYVKRKETVFPFKNYVQILRTQPPKATEIKLYKGVKSEHFYAQAQAFNEGNILEPDQFESFTTDKKLAKEQLNSKGTLIVVFTKFAIELGQDASTGETEYIVPPGAKFRINNIRKANKFNLYHVIELVDLEVVIRTIRDDYVFDVSDGKTIKVKKFDGEEDQRWYIQGNYIVNKETGKVLDVHGSKGPGTDLIVHELHGKANQEWSYQDGVLKSEHDNLVGDVKRGDDDKDALCAFTEHGGNNQRFYFKTIK